MGAGIARVVQLRPTFSRATAAARAAAPGNKTLPPSLGLSSVLVTIPLTSLAKHLAHFPRGRARRERERFTIAPGGFPLIAARSRFRRAITPDVRPARRDATLVRQPAAAAAAASRFAVRYIPEVVFLARAPAFGCCGFEVEFSEALFPFFLFAGARCSIALREVRRDDMWGSLDDDLI